MQEIRADLKEIKADVKALNIQVAKNTVSLDLHMARTEASELRITKVENWLLGLMTTIVLSVFGIILKLVLH